MKYKIYYFSNSRGDEIVANFISSLDVSTRARTMRLIDLLEVYGNRLGLPYSKKITRQLYELRARGKNHIRIIYSFIGNDIFLLHGFKKKTSKIPKKELELAQKRYKYIVDRQ